MLHVLLVNNRSHTHVADLLFLSVHWFLHEENPDIIVHLSVRLSPNVPVHFLPGMTLRIFFLRF